MLFALVRTPSIPEPLPQSRKTLLEEACLFQTARPLKIEDGTTPNLVTEVSPLRAVVIIPVDELVGDSAEFITKQTFGSCTANYFWPRIRAL
jgi:hypothetical protein